ncbi:hypothetical protein KY363_07145 [Candidatus Woesearchaeota archaeon]|nr:hypothetical protein [Candidatus Woesearchaeota archaeon]
MRGYRQVGILVAALAILAVLALLSGCTSKCRPESTVQEKPVTQTVELYADEPYNETETRVVGQKCIDRVYSEMNNSRFNISMAPKEWLGDETIGASGRVRRVVTVFNALDETDAVYLDKIYLYNGTEIRRSTNPMMFLVEPKSTRTLYFMWDTQYDPLKDVQAAFTNNTENLGFETTTARLCINQTEKYNVTKYRKVVVGTEEEITGYDKTVRVKLDRNCK